MVAYSNSVVDTSVFIFLIDEVDPDLLNICKGGGVGSRNNFRAWGKLANGVFAVQFFGHEEVKEKSEGLDPPPAGVI